MGKVFLFYAICMHSQEPLTESVRKGCDSVRDRSRGSGLGFEFRATPWTKNAQKRQILLYRTYNFTLASHPLF
jgi:hypothetical protein